MAQADAIYLDRNVIDPSEVGVSRFGGKKYSRETKLDASSRAATAPQQTPAIEESSSEAKGKEPAVSEAVKSAAINGGPTV